MNERAGMKEMEREKQIWQPNQKSERKRELMEKEEKNAKRKK